MTLQLILVATFGAFIGSFLNVVIWRMPRGKKFAAGRSHCPHCGEMIAWHDNIPILSYLVLRARCRHCSERISIRYPLIEALTAGVFALSWWRAHEQWQDPVIVAAVIYAAFAAVLVAASAIDFEHKILPDKLTLRTLPVIATAGSLLVPTIHGTELFGRDLAAGGAMKPALASLLVGLAGYLVGAGVVWSIRALGTLALKREAMGLGDVKLWGACGFLLGPGGAMLGLGVAVLAGGVLGVAIWVVTRNREIPFGPFLAIGALAVLWYREPIREFVRTVYGI